MREQRHSLNSINTRLSFQRQKAKKLIDGGYAGKNVVFGIRPEDIYDSAEHLDKFASCKIDSDVTGYELLGAEVLLYFTVAGANYVSKS